MKENESISWHPSFAAALQLELREYEHDLKYVLEYPLTTEPLKVDVLILKFTAKPIDKNIARLFRTYNIIEYKSPKTTLPWMTYTRRWPTYTCIRQCRGSRKAPEPSMSSK